MAGQERRIFTAREIINTVGTMRTLNNDRTGARQDMPPVGQTEAGFFDFTDTLRRSNFPTIARALEITHDAENRGGEPRGGTASRDVSNRFGRLAVVTFDMAEAVAANAETLNAMVPRRRDDAPQGRRGELVVGFYEQAARVAYSGENTLRPAAQYVHALAEQPGFLLSPMMEYALLRRDATPEGLLVPPEKDPHRELPTMEDVGELIGEQSADRMHPYTSISPFAYAHVTEDGGDTWTVAQIVGQSIPIEGVPAYQFGFNTGERGFLAFKEVILKPDDLKQYSVHNTDEREARGSFAVTEEWFADPQHSIRAVPVETAEGRIFSAGAREDLPLLTTGALRYHRDAILERGLRDEVFDVDRESRQLVRIAKALSHHGEHHDTVEMIATISTDFPDYRFHPDDLLDLVVIRNIQRSRASR